jgi:hypothetical protein
MGVGLPPPTLPRAMEAGPLGLKEGMAHPQPTQVTGLPRCLATPLEELTVDTPEGLTHTLTLLTGSMVLPTLRLLPLPLQALSLGAPGRSLRTIRIGPITTIPPRGSASGRGPRTCDGLVCSSSPSLVPAVIELSHCLSVSSIVSFASVPVPVPLHLSPPRPLLLAACLSMPVVHEMSMLLIDLCCFCCMM